MRRLNSYKETSVLESSPAARAEHNSNPSETRNKHPDSVFLRTFHMTGSVPVESNKVLQPHQQQRQRMTAGVSGESGPGAANHCSPQ